MMTLLYFFKWFFIGLISLAFLLSFLIYVIAPRFIIETSHPLLKEKLNEDSNPSEDSPGRYIHITTEDQYDLEAFWAYNTTAQNVGTVILIHGITKTKEIFQPLSRYLTQNGFHTVALDLRAHGKSQGKYTTFGFQEKKDISRLVDFLEKEGHNNIGIWGQSLGGATSIQAMAYDKRLKFGVIESTFSSMKNIVHVYFKHYLGFNYKPLSSYITWRAGEIGGFDPNSIIPSEDCKQIDQPILMVHGKKDKKISIKYGQRNFKNLKSKIKQFIAVDNANHVNVWEMAGNQKYFDKVIAFIKSIPTKSI
ncbi:MAG: alpha/beta hydrolase [Flavobacteriales bacterium]